MAIQKWNYITLQIKVSSINSVVFEIYYMLVYYIIGAEYLEVLAPATCLHYTPFTYYRLKPDEMEFVDVKIENIAETDGASTSSEVRVTEVR